ncbi:glycosyltransferase [Agromyces sp. NPDC058484]|uniref:glycosyltransferase n=1 Tax=Agromyces sp. NPDC058484 TaxID=3346524 RepID=UPI003668F41E
MLQSFPEGRPTTNPYLLQLSDSLRPSTVVLGFSWPRALFARYDVFHVHWPELLCRGTTPARSLARRTLVRALLMRLRLTRVALVRTLHNASPHEQGGRSEGELLRRLDARTTLWIALNPTTARPSAAHPGSPLVTIPHGDYRAWFERMPRPGQVPGRLAFAGFIRPYKGVEELMAAFAALPDDSLTLRIVGRPASPELATAIRTSAGADHRISLNLDYVSDEELAEELGRAELVVLPYRTMHNSGAALLALSLGRPVLVPVTEVNASLSREVGAGWVHTFSPPLAPHALARAIAALRETPRSPAPDLSERTWPGIADLHREAYDRAVRLVRSRATALSARASG